MNLTWLIFALLLHSCHASCPNKCKCPTPNLVDCSNAGLFDIPASLPATTTNLDLSLNQISSVPAKAFAAVPNLRFLNMNHNKISSLSSEALNDVKLENVSLANNRFQDSSDIGGIAESNTILDLNLANNFFTKIPTIKSTSLRRLTLSSNAIRTAAFPASFSSCFNLQSVVLSGNQIASIDAEDFNSLSALKIVSLSLKSNRITSVDAKAVTAVGFSLTSLDLDRNRLTASALASALKGFEQVPSIILTSLSVSYNAITKFDANVLKPLAYTIFNTLQMDGHRNLDLDPKAFQDVVGSLKVLSLRDCGLSALPDAVQTLSGLKTLRVDGNSFATLPENLPSNLVSLSVTRAGLEGWSGTALSVLKNLEELDVSGNALATITADATNPLGESAKRLRLLGLTANPLNCSCELSWFVRWASSSNSVRQFESLTCAAPDKMAGSRLQDLDIPDCGDEKKKDAESDEKRTNDAEEKGETHHKKKRHHDEKTNEAKKGHRHHKKKLHHDKTTKNGPPAKSSNKKHHKKHHSKHHKEL